MDKINTISINGNNNIVIQDVSGNTKIYINSDEGARELIEDFKQEISEIRSLLRQRQEPVLQQFAEKIYNIANINIANFYGEGRIKIEKAGKVTIDNRKLNEKQKYHLEMLEGLERRFQNRLNEKMKTELRFQLELNLQYTKEGTEETYLKDYYILSYDEKSVKKNTQLFRDYETTLKRLLFLGEAGSGKTVLLLQFGLDLIALAKQDFGYPTPILLNLATWRDEAQTFETWLEENLVYAAGEYGTAKKYAKEMVQENNLLLLLDGLDEVPENNRKACLEKLRAFLDKLDNSRPVDCNYPTVIISSRKQEYLKLGLKAPVRATIDIAPLTPDAVCKELERIKQSGSDFAKKMLNHIAEMPEIAERLTTAFEIHLSLNMIQTFNFMDISTENLVNAYLIQEIDKLEKEYPETRHYLSFLATKMKEKGVTFELIDMQPDWVGSVNLYAIKFGVFNFIFVSAIGILLFNFAIGLLIGFVFGGLSFYAIYLERDIKSNEIRNLNLKEFKLENMIVGVIFGIKLSFVIGLMYGIVLGFSYTIPFIIATSCITGSSSAFFHAKRFVKITGSYQRLVSPIIFDFFQITLMFIFSFLICYVFEFYIPPYFYLRVVSINMIGAFFLSPIIKHFFLRFLLYIENKLPLRYSSFLNKVSQTGIMEKDGGQWRFRHQLLQDALLKSK